MAKLMYATRQRPAVRSKQSGGGDTSPEASKEED
jgi:hypothetical protein